MTDMIGQPVGDTVRRNHWGQYMVLPPGADKPTGYVRATTVAKVLDDTSSLMTWNARMTALGLAARADLYAALTTADPDDRKAIDSICKRASEAGGATVRRDLGTAIHAMLEQSYTNPDYVAPEQFRADIESVHQALRDAGAQVLPQYVERMVVLDDLQIAGTCDGVLEINGERFLFDNKTGSLTSLKFGNLAWAIQMAIYSQADALYTQGVAADGSQDVREPMPDVSRERAVIIHIEPNTAACTLHWIDLTVGADALQVALDVRRFRKVKPLEPFTTRQTVQGMGIEPAPHEQVDRWRESTRQRLMAIVAHSEAKQMVGHMWPAGVPTIKSGDPISPEQQQQVDLALSAIEKEHGLPFPDIDADPPVIDSESLAAPKRAPAPDEGRNVTQDEIDALAAMAQELPENCRAIVNDTLKACTKANRPIRLTGRGGKPSEHRLEVCKALVALAHFDDTDLIMAAIATATGQPRRTTDTLGDQLGGLTIQQARNLQSVAKEMTAGQLIPMWDDNGTAYLFGNWPPVNN